MKKSVLIIVISILALLILDRIMFMPERIKQTWLNESGRNLGDPLAYKQDFELVGSKIIFKNNKDEENYPHVYRNRQSNFYLIGCYLGSLYIYDKDRSEIIVYSDY